MGKTNRNLELLSFSFNQDTSCFACGTSSGFRVYNSEPFQESLNRHFLLDGKDAGISIVEMLFRCNIMAIVGGGKNPRYPPNKVMIWDDHQKKCIGELGFRSPVRAVRLRRDKVVVVLEQTVLMYNFHDLKLDHSTETLPNPQGLVSVSASPEHNVLACPGLQAGQVRVELYDVRRTKFVQAHTSLLAALALSQDGRLLATASERGTLVRLFHALDGTRLQELRRGVDAACIYSIAFAKGEKPPWLAISSDKGTVHVFSLGGQHAGGAAALQTRSSSGKGEPQPPPGDAPPGASPAAPSGAPQGEQQPQQQNGASALRNPTSALSFVSSILPVSYFSSERSFAQMRLPEDSRTLVGFGPQPNTLLVVSASGSFYSAAFDAVKGGMSEQRAYCKFLELEAEQPSPAKRT